MRTNASEFGYELSKEELDAVMNTEAAELSEEELGKIAGGTSCGWVGATVLIGLVGLGTITAVVEKNLD